MLIQIYISLIFIAFVFLIISLWYREKPAVKTTYLLLTMILFVLLSLSSSNIKNNHCKNYKETSIDINQTEVTCQDPVYIFDQGLAVTFGGLALFSFVLFIIFVLSLLTEKGDQI